MKDALRAGFEARAAAYAEEVRRLMLNRLDPSWSFSTLFLVKDGLAGEVGRQSICVAGGLQGSLQSWLLSRQPVWPVGEQVVHAVTSSRRVGGWLLGCSLIHNRAWQAWTQVVACLPSCVPAACLLALLSPCPPACMPSHPHVPPSLLPWCLRLPSLAIFLPACSHAGSCWAAGGCIEGVFRARSLLPGGSAGGERGEAWDCLL